MQITSLYIEDYKLLKKFTINFNKNISILIGINGSGKSTILETIAQIFSDAYLREKSKFGFKLEYELRLEEIIEQTATTSEFKTDYIKVEIYTGEKDEKLLYKVYTGNDILEKEIIPMYYEDYPKWLGIVKEGMKDVRTAFDSNRMAHEYYEIMYK